MLKSKIQKIQGSSVRRVLSTPPSLCLSEGGAQVVRSILLFRMFQNGAKHSPLSLIPKFWGSLKGVQAHLRLLSFFRFFIRLNVNILFKFEYFRKLEQDRKFNHLILLLMASVICGNSDRNSRNKDFDI